MFFHAMYMSGARTRCVRQGQGYDSSLEIHTHMSIERYKGNDPGPQAAFVDDLNEF
jgi:hypothetical protein